MDQETPQTQEGAQTPVTPEPEAKPELSIDERIAQSLARHEAGAATESAPEKPAESVEEADKAAADTTDEKTGEVEAKTEETKDEAPEPFTAEQLRDPKFFDRLDKDGWARLEKLHPALYEMGKAVASARGKAYQELQQLKKAAPSESVDSTQPKVPEDRKALLAKLDSLDDDERAQALDAIIDAALREKLPKLTGIEPNEAQAAAVGREAFRMAVDAMPEMAKLSDDDLGAAVEADPNLMELLELAATTPREQSVRITANVMKRAGQAVLAKQKAEADAAAAKRQAEEAKLRERQTRVKSNASNPSNVLQEQAPAKVPTGKRSAEEIYEANLKRLGVSP